MISGTERSAESSVRQANAKPACGVVLGAARSA
jgi:hypothetical protein